MRKVTCWVIGSGGVWLTLPADEYLKRAYAGEVQGVGVEAVEAHLSVR